MNGMYELQCGCAFLLCVLAASEALTDLFFNLSIFGVFEISPFFICAIYMSSHHLSGHWERILDPVLDC